MKPLYGLDIKCRTGPCLFLIDFNASQLFKKYGLKNDQIMLSMVFNNTPRTDLLQLNLQNLSMGKNVLFCSILIQEINLAVIGLFLGVKKNIIL